MILKLGEYLARHAGQADATPGDTGTEARIEIVAKRWIGYHVAGLASSASSSSNAFSRSIPAASTPSSLAR